MNKMIVMLLIMTSVIQADIRLNNDLVVVDFYSYHSNHIYNNNNYGIGYFHSFNKYISTGGGVYHNSINKTSMYGGIEIGSNLKNLTYGILIGAASGYRVPIVPVGFVKIGYMVTKKTEINLLYADDRSFEKVKSQASAIVHLQVRFKF